MYKEVSPVDFLQRDWLAAKRAAHIRKTASDIFVWDSGRYWIALVKAEAYDGGTLRRIKSLQAYMEPGAHLPIETTTHLLII